MNFGKRRSEEFNFGAIPICGRSVRVGPLRFCTQVTCGWQMGRSEKRTTEASRGSLLLLELARGGG